MSSALHDGYIVVRERKDGYPVSERTKGFADLLQKVVDRLDSGDSPDDWGCWVQCIGRSMGRRDR